MTHAHILFSVQGLVIMKYYNGYKCVTDSMYRTYEKHKLEPLAYKTH